MSVFRRKREKPEPDRHGLYPWEKKGGLHPPRRPPPPKSIGTPPRAPLNLSDPAIRQMVEDDHTPEESWTIAGELVSVHCRCCGHSWPCPSVQLWT